jgi:hypothetical protein
MQLDFLSGYKNETKLIETEVSQVEFWDQDFNPLKISRKPSYSRVEKFFENLDYSGVPVYRDYWRSIAPDNDSEVFKRWLFAFMSVHTSWKANMAGYNAIKDWWKWINKWDELYRLIDDSRVGMQNNRLRFISEFAHKFWENPNRYKKQEDESWTEFRNRLKELTLGLGKAKTSFALEMCYPTLAKITCLDTHMFQAYGLDQTKDLRQYDAIEQHWVDMCNMWNVSPYIARCIYWDQKQNKSDSRYWSVVLEK